MSEGEHCMVSREFEHCVYDELRVMGVRNHILSLGSTEAIMGNWRKRPDECWTTKIVMLSSQNEVD